MNNWKIYVSILLISTPSRKRVEDFHIFGKEFIDKSDPLSIYAATSSCFINTDKKFKKIPFPAEAQFAPVYAMSIEDFDNDKIPNNLLEGNFHFIQPRSGFLMEAGCFLKGQVKELLRQSL